MLITNHVLAGGIIAARTESVRAALALGFASHFAMDAIPHWGVDDDAEYIRIARIDGVTGLAVSAAVLLSAPPEDRVRTAAAIFGACFPDTDQVSMHFFDRGFHPRLLNDFHNAIQTEHGWMAQEVIVAGVLLSALVWLRRTRG